jgi:hypothetical protein
VLDYSVLNNDSRPLLSKAQMVELQKWGNQNATFIQKFAYKLTPLIRNDKDVWHNGPISVSTLGIHKYKTPAFIVNVFVPEDANLAIFDNAGFVPDYLYYGDTLSRKLFDYTDEKRLDTLGGDIDFVLVNPDIQTSEINKFQLIFTRKGWKLFKRVIP